MESLVAGPADSYTITSPVPTAAAKSPSSLLRPFMQFQRNYVLIYLVMMTADWLQGPYVYALYAHYGFSKGDIGLLFTVGFGSSMIFGTIVGSAADSYGRKRLCLLFGVLYSLSCLTKHIADFRVLLVGRFLAGISTSILFSSFESWMVSEHTSSGYPSSWLGSTFALCTTGNGLVAIGSGVVASVVRDRWGPVAPFDVSLICLIIGSVLVARKWKENTGDASIDVAHTLSNAWVKMRDDSRIIWIGVIQSFFEGSMYVFVFMWTPALEATSPFEGSNIAHGWIFATFMVCVLIGSALFQFFLDLGWSIERTTLGMLFVSAFSLLFPVLSESHLARLVSFCLFEVMVGLFWPSLGFLRSKYVEEEVRATTINFFRFPLNLIVVIVLTRIGAYTDAQVFGLCFALLLPPIVCQVALIQRVEEDAQAATSVGKKAGKWNGEMEMSRSTDGGRDDVGEQDEDIDETLPAGSPQHADHRPLLSETS